MHFSNLAPEYIKVIALAEGSAKQRAVLIRVCKHFREALLQCPFADVEPFIKDMARNNPDKIVKLLQMAWTARSLGEVRAATASQFGDKWTAVKDSLKETILSQHWVEMLSPYELKRHKERRANREKHARQCRIRKDLDFPSGSVNLPCVFDVNTSRSLDVATSEWKLNHFRGLEYARSPGLKHCNRCNKSAVLQLELFKNIAGELKLTVSALVDLCLCFDDGPMFGCYDDGPPERKDTIGTFILAACCPTDGDYTDEDDLLKISLRVGDSIEVRDTGGEWAVGTVEALNDTCLHSPEMLAILPGSDESYSFYPPDPLVLVPGFAEAYVWDECRPSAIVPKGVETGNSGAEEGVCVVVLEQGSGSISSPGNGGNDGDGCVGENKRRSKRPYE